MAFNLVVTSQASIDIVEACAYYNSKQGGLSERFLSELQSVYSNLTENPQHYSFVSAKRKNKIRDIVIKGFPYLVIFDIQENTVTVYAVFNSHRKPKYK